MYKNILVAIALDHSRDMQAAIEVARTLASADAAITAISIIEDIPTYVSAQLPPDVEETAMKAVEADLRKDLGGAADITLVVARGHAGRIIVDYAEEHSIDCIVMGSHRPGLQEYVMGATASRVVRHAPCAVHVVR